MGTSRASLSAVVLILSLTLCGSSRESVGALLRDWTAKGEAAGNAGDTYQNLDGEHALLNVGAHPGLKSLPVRRIQTVRGEHPYKLPGKERSGVSEIGNASLSTPDRSLIVDVMIGPEASHAYEHYVHNRHWFHPAHHNYAHPTLKEKVDTFPAMFPYLTASVGSSGTELDEVTKFAHALAALRPEVKSKLKESGLLMPTLQMCFRRSRVSNDDEYLSGKAHPTAFDDRDSGLAMVKLAHEIRADSIPPMVQLRVLGETYSAKEKLFDTPAAVARLYRDKSGFKTLAVTAEESYDLNKRPLTCHWVVLRGDPKRVVIEKKNKTGSRVVIKIAPHAASTIEGTDIQTHLVAVGAFVHNGAFYSAPGFVTSYNPVDDRKVFDGNGNPKP